MRLALVSLIALSLAPAAAAAQTPAAAPPAPNAAPAAPASPRAAAAPAAPPAAAAPAAPPTASAPPSPPAAPTDPTAVAVMSVLQNVCIPAANGGDLNKLAKAGGYRKSGDNWTLRQRDFTVTIEPPGSTNPNQCHVDVTHPVDPTRLATFTVTHPAWPISKLKDLVAAKERAMLEFFS